MIKPEWWPVFERARKDAEKGLADALKWREERQAEVDALLDKYGKRYRMRKEGGYMYLPELKLALALDREHVEPDAPHSTLLRELGGIEVEMYRGGNEDSLAIVFDDAVSDYVKNERNATIARKQYREQRKVELNLAILTEWLDVIEELGDTRKVGRVVSERVNTMNITTPQTQDSIAGKIKEFKDLTRDYMNFLENLSEEIPVPAGTGFPPI